MKTSHRITTATLVAGIATLAVWFCLPTTTAAENEKTQKKDRAVERTRETVRMLDDVYKSAVVLITEHYVNEEDDLPAGSAAIALFDAVKKKGWHEVKLLDVTGEPYNDKNVAKDEFRRCFYDMRSPTFRRQEGARRRSGRGNEPPVGAGASEGRPRAGRTARSRLSP